LASRDAAALVVAIGFGARLAFSAKPKSTPTLQFAGFIPLPASGSGLLHTLGHPTVDGADLYVTNESSGAVDEVPIGAVVRPG
jgi:hypothetical protein